MTGQRILVADTPESVVALRAALTTSLPLHAVSTLEEARAAVAQTPLLVICGCHFDEGRMYDLLRLLKAEPALSKVPFMAVRCLEGELEDAIYESVKIAVRALGGNAFVDLLRWQRKYGEQEASHRLTRTVETLAHAQGDSE
jgi:CheY-like chemotaxis protein